MTMSGELRRRPRQIEATDSEWQQLGEQAAAAGLTVSDLIMRSMLTPPDPPLQGLPPAVQWRMARELSLLVRIEEIRLRARGDVTVWNAIVAEVTADLDIEAVLG